MNCSFLRPILSTIMFGFLTLWAMQSFAQTRTCTKNDSERQCMICNCFFEAEGEPDQGKLAVNVVVLARMNSNLFKETSVCSTVWKPAQFSWTQDKKPNSLSTSTPAYKACAAKTDLALTRFTAIRNPTHYYAATGPNAVKAPAWSKAEHFSVYMRVGHHVFLNDSREKFIQMPKALSNLMSGASQ